MKRILNSILVGVVACLLPLVVNAEIRVKEIGDVVYTIESKKIEEYMCDNVKSHTLYANHYGDDNKLQVYDITTQKIYLFDLSNPGVCNEVSEELEPNFQHDDYRYNENDNKLYLDIYSHDLDWYFVKTSDEEIKEKNYYIKESDGNFTPVDEPNLLDIQNYYESVKFDPAKGEYNGEADYYIIVDSNVDIREVKLVKDEDKNVEDFNDNKYYVLATPVRSEVIATITTNEFVVNKNKIGFENDFVGSKDNFLYHIVYDNKTYLVFIDFDSQVRFVFDAAGNYQTFGYDNILVKDISNSRDGKYIYLLAVLDNEEYHLVLDSGNKEVLSIKKENRLDYISFAGNIDNKRYILFGEISEEIIEINEYSLISGAKQQFKNEDLTFKFTGNINKLSNVKVNNKELDSQNYIKEEGSTIITLKKSYLETLEKGTYTLKVEYSDGGYSNVDFEITEKLPNNPKTFDGINNSFIMLSISLIGMISTTIYLRKKES